MATSKLDLRNGYFREGSVEVAPPKPGEGGTRRLALTSETLLTSPSPDVHTIPDVVDHAVRNFGKLSAVGWREVVNVHEEKKVIKKVVDGREVEDTKTWKYFELGDPQYMDFEQYQEAIKEVARALVSLEIEKGDIINVYAQTSVNWQLISHGCALISTPIATSYDSLGQEGLTHSLNEPDCVGLFTNAELLPTVLKVLPNTPTVKFVFYDGAPAQSLVDQITSIRDNVKAFHINELRGLGKEQPLSLLEGRYPTPDATACIMYTSGSTGTPKGVEITHANLIASVAAVDFLYVHHIPPGTVYLAYLPLAHVLEFIVELCAVFVGATSVYARPKTLTDASVRNCKGDLTAYKPTVLFGVPAVWETIRKGIVGKLDQVGWVIKAIVEAAMEVKKREIPVLSWIADRYILSMMRAATGGQIKWGVNGGAAINPDTQEFLSLAVMPLMQGYGMTESCGMCAILPPELQQYGVVGLPVPSVEIKLIDVPEMGYVSENSPPQGEVCIRGPSVTKGYYKRPDLNNDPTIFTKDGWLRTGDVGQWNEDGTLKLIDRLKNLIKLQSGEYIALEHLESVYKSCKFVANLCVYASQDASQPVAVIFPHESNIRAVLRSANPPSPLANADIHDICKDKEVKQLVLKECNELARKNKFKQAEMFKGVVLTPDEWTPDNGLVTAAQKVNRGAIAKVFKEEIKVVYSS